MHHQQRNTLYPPKVADVAKKNFLPYLDLCYVNPVYHELYIKTHSLL